MITAPYPMEPFIFNSQLRHPFNLICSAATQGGKSHWITQLLLTKKITPAPEKIIYIYAFPSSRFGDLKLLYDIEFRTDIPDNIAEESFTDKRKPTLIILDDQLTSINEDVLNLFIRGTHHLNRSCILTVQNIFFQNPSMRTISLNAHYIVLFKQPRDISQIEALGRQMFPSQGKLFLAAYKSAVQRDFGYLLIDLKSTTDDRLRLRADLLGEDHNGWQRVFVIRDSTMETYVLVPISEVLHLQTRCSQNRPSVSESVQQTRPPKKKRPSLAPLQRKKKKASASSKRTSRMT